MNFFRTTGQQAQIYVMGRKPSIVDAVLAEVDGRLAYWTVAELLEFIGLDSGARAVERTVNGEEIYIVRTQK